MEIHIVHSKLVLKDISLYSFTYIKIINARNSIQNIKFFKTHNKTIDINWWSLQNPILVMILNNVVCLQNCNKVNCHFLVELSRDKVTVQAFMHIPNRIKNDNSRSSLHGYMMIAEVCLGTLARLEAANSLDFTDAGREVSGAIIGVVCKWLCPRCTVAQSSSNVHCGTGDKTARICHNQCFQ